MLGKVKDRTCAIIVAAGTGSRMKMDCPKQFLIVNDKPVLYYTLKAFEESQIDEVVVVTSKAYVGYVEQEIVKQFNFTKVSSVVAGGKERYESVYEGIKACNLADYVLVHDGARPFIKPELIDKVICEVKIRKALVVGVKAKDTVKIASVDQSVESTPDRSRVWYIQTPQAFTYEIIKTAYDIIIQSGDYNITDDAMVVEKTMNYPIYIMEGDYTNIKITTPEDLTLAYLTLK